PPGRAVGVGAVRQSRAHAVGPGARTAARTKLGTVWVGWDHADPGAAALVSAGAVFAPAFLASAVEAIEMAVIVIGVGATRGWRWTLTGAAGGAAVLAVLVAGLGRALTVVPISSLRLVVGGLLLVFGLQWLRKGIRRVAA